MKNYLQSLPYTFDSYKEITRLNNVRLEIEEEDHLLVIDKSIYNGITDYNLEIETKDSIENAKKVLHYYIDKFNLVNRKQKYVGKASRAILSAINKD